MTMQSPPVRGYRFDQFTLDLARRRLTGAGPEPLALSGRAFEVLAFLLANRDRMVAKRELLEAVWPRMVVEENNLTQAISGLRRALGDSRESPRFIATIAGRGYQFVGDAKPWVDGPAADGLVSPSADLVPVAEAPAVPAPPENIYAALREAGVVSDAIRTPDVSAPTVTRRGLLAGAGVAAAIAVAGGAWWFSRPAPSRLPASIAVLPFKPLLAPSRNEAIEIGVAELLINRLSALPGVVITPLSSVRRYSSVDQDPLAAGRELGVAAVVDGTVQIERDDVRLTARLLDVATGKALWAGNYTEKLDDFFAVQDALVTQLVSALAVDVPVDARQRLVSRSTADTEAWQLYASGRYQLERRDPDGIQRARELFQSAIDRDPRFVAAITGLSEACALSGTFGLMPPLDAFEQARAAAQRALDIDPSSPGALTALGHVLTQLDRDWQGGRRLYQRALALEPNSGWTHAWLALNLIQVGQASAALDHISQAQGLEPAVAPFMVLGGFIRYHARQFEAASKVLSRIVESAPGAVLPRQFLARTLVAQGDALGAIKLLEGRNHPAPGSYSTLGRAYAMTGNVAGARAEMARVEAEGAKRFGVGFDLALLHLALDERELAYAALERAIDDGSQMLGYIMMDAALDPIRNEPRVIAVARRIGVA
jgi:DNA-binding winged helix-turn-helix (wHTH) protein/TolB-like protein/Tfp pilus assembly protein PilF